MVHALTLLTEPEQVVELRALDVVTGKWTKTVSGYFTDMGKLADAALHVAPSAKGVYVVLNPIQPDLLARAANRVRDMGKGDTSTTDTQILRRKWLPIDADPCRASGISSSDAEHAAALVRIRTLQVFLRERGWPEPIVGDSGNGAHALWRIDLPVDANDTLVQRVIEAIASRFSDDQVEIDRTVFNPARIWKLYGSVARKGDHIAERPHRLAHILSVPEPIGVVSREQLEALVLELTPPQPTPSRTAPQRVQSGQRAWSIDAWIEQHALDVRSPQPYNGGRKWLFNACPFNPEHTGGSAALFERENGALAFKCHHDSCHGYGWSDLRELVGGPKQPRLSSESEPPALPPGYPPEPSPATDPIPEPATPMRTPSGLKDLLRRELPPVKWAVPDLIPQGLTILAGRPKTGKSWLALALVIAVGSGGHAFGQVQTERGNVLYLALEDNLGRLKSRALRLLGADWSHWDGSVDFETAWESLDRGGYRRLDEYLSAHPDTRLVVIDTFAKIRPAVRSKSGVSYDEDYRAMGMLKALADQHQTAIVVIHHTRKGAAEDPQDLVSGTTGLTGAADSTMVLFRTRQEHEAGLFVTGRDIEEQQLTLVRQPESCSWVVTGESAEALRLTALQRKVVDFFRSCNWEPCRKKDVLLGAGLDAQRGGKGYKVLERMERDGNLVPADGYNVQVAEHLRDTPRHTSTTYTTSTTSTTSIASTTTGLDTHDASTAHDADGVNGSSGVRGVHDVPAPYVPAHMHRVYRWLGGIWRCSHCDGEWALDDLPVGSVAYWMPGGFREWTRHGWETLSHEEVRVRQDAEMRVCLGDVDDESASASVDCSEQEADSCLYCGLDAVPGKRYCSGCLGDPACDHYLVGTPVPPDGDGTGWWWCEKCGAHFTNQPEWEECNLPKGIKFVWHGFDYEWNGAVWVREVNVLSHVYIMN